MNAAKSITTPAARALGGVLGLAAFLAATPARSEPEVHPTLLAEADARSFRAPVEGRTGFALARVRPGVLISPLCWFTANASIDLVPNVLVLNAFGTITVSKWFDVEVGQSRPPLFASFRNESIETMPFPDRSPLILSMRVRRDVGVSAHVLSKDVPFESWLRIGSGSASNVTRSVDRPAMYGLFDLVLGRANAKSAGDQLLGLRAGVSGMTEVVDERDGISGISPTGFVYHRPTIVSGARAIGETHVVGYVGPVRANFEAAVGREGRSVDVDGNPATPRAPLASVTSSGISAEIAWTIRGRWRTVGRAPTSPDDSYLGAVELAARYDALAFDHGAADVAPGGYRGGAVSLKWYPLPFAALTAAGYYGVYDVGPIEDPGRTDTYTLLLRASFYWGRNSMKPPKPR